MKIYEIGTGYTPIPAKLGAATEIVVEELTKSLLKTGKDVSIIDIKAADRRENALPIIEVPVPSKCTGTDVKLGVLHKLKRVVYSVSLASTMKKLIKGSKEKVVLHFHNQYNMFFFLKLTSKKMREKCFIAYTNHSYIWHGAWENIKAKVISRYFQEIASMKNADMIYVLNEHTIDTLVNHIGIDRKKIKLVDNGVNTEVYRPLSKEDKAQFKEKLGLAGKKVYLQIGSVCDRKNQLGALKLLRPLLTENKNTVFAYVGGIISEEYQEEIMRYTTNNGLQNQVIYMGEFTPGKLLNKYYNLADVMVFPSKSEGFSLVIIEAMSAGVPVIVNKDLQFRLSDECLKYIDEKDFIEIFKHEILDEKKQYEMSQHVREAVIRNYSWDKIANDYVESWVL